MTKKVELVNKYLLYTLSKNYITLFKSPIIYRNIWQQSSYRKIKEIDDKKKAIEILEYTHKETKAYRRKIFQLTKAQAVDLILNNYKTLEVGKLINNKVFPWDKLHFLENGEFKCQQDKDSYRN